MAQGEENHTHSLTVTLLLQRKHKTLDNGRSSSRSDCARTDAGCYHAEPRHARSRTEEMLLHFQRAPDTHKESGGLHQDQPAVPQPRCAVEDGDGPSAVRPTYRPLGEGHHQLRGR